MKKWLKKIMFAVTTAAVVAVPVIASADTPNAAQAAMTTAFTSIAGDITSSITSVLPIALGILGLTLVIRFSVKWFKGLVGRS
jgi:hypothetical protein